MLTPEVPLGIVYLVEINSLIIRISGAYLIKWTAFHILYILVLMSRIVGTLNYITQRSLNRCEILYYDPKYEIMHDSVKSLFIVLKWE